MTNSRDYSHIDSTKGILILLVVIGHVLITLNPDYDKLFMCGGQEFIYSFHMPAFFIIHGALTNNEKWRKRPASEYIIKRLKRLLIPFFIFEAIGIVWKLIFQQQDLLTGLWNVVTLRCNVGADWFLPAMLMGTLLLLIYIKRPCRVMAMIAVVVCLAAPMFFPHKQLFIVLGRGILAFAFIMIGNMAKNLFLSPRISRFPAIVCMFVVTLACAFVNLKFGWSNDFYNCNVNNPLTLLVGGCCGTLMIIGISDFVKCSLLDNIGCESLIIMGTHQLPIYAAVAIPPCFIGGGIVEGLMLAMSVVIFEIIIIVLARFLRLLKNA